MSKSQRDTDEFKHVEFSAVELPHNDERNWILVQVGSEYGSIPAVVSAGCRLARGMGNDLFTIEWATARKSSVRALKTVFGKSLTKLPGTHQNAKYSVTLNIYGEIQS